MIKTLFKRFLSAFTLIELMIVVAIIGILAAIAYPSYMNHVIKTRRSDAKVALLNLTAQMERYFSSNASYVGATIGTGSNSDVLASSISPEGWYQLSLPTITATGYTAQAAPRNAQATNDTECATLTINNLNQQGITGTGTVADCW